MKRALSVILVFFTFFSCAFAEDIDLSSMDEEQLRSIISDAWAALARLEAKDDNSWVIFDDHGIIVTMEDVRLEYNTHLGFDITVINNSDYDIIVMVEDMYINDWTVGGTNGPAVRAGKKGKDTVLWLNVDHSAEIKSIDDLKELCFFIQIEDYNTFDALYESPVMTLTF